MTDGPMAMVSLIITPDGDRDTIAQQRAWIIPAGSAEAFAAAMTERYGVPVAESIAPVGVMIEAAERDAGAGHLFYEREGESGHG